ncbi:MAG: hypothetical protein MZV63_36160 [Marinilabiliales bacterium]|nr:hypothetical protein [Marinilabiliales bacterium]
MRLVRIGASLMTTHAFEPITRAAAAQILGISGHSRQTRPGRRPTATSTTRKWQAAVLVTRAVLRLPPPRLATAQSARLGRSAAPEQSDTTKGAADIRIRKAQRWVHRR